MGIDIITRVTIICDKGGAVDSLSSKANDRDVIGIVTEHLTEGDGWVRDEATTGVSYCYCKKCKPDRPQTDELDG